VGNANRLDGRRDLPYVGRSGAQAALGGLDRPGEIGFVEAGAVDADQRIAQQLRAVVDANSACVVLRPCRSMRGARLVMSTSRISSVGDGSFACSATRGAR
jgi:hypothetical protein